MLVAGSETAFDKTYPVRDAVVETWIDPGGGEYRNFADDTMRALAAEGILYSEQSVGLGKLEKKFPAAMMKELAAKHGIDVRLLAMVNTRALAGAASAEEANAVKDQLRRTLMRGDVIGIDIAGPEARAFTGAGMDRFEELYDLVREAAAARKRPLVLRPHVGEGYDDPKTGAHDGSHATIARANLEAIITRLEAMGYNDSKGARDGVVIRFGHAAHATPTQNERLATLGVYVESNIGSNLATRSLLRPEDHPLIYQLYYGVKTVLGTDGQGVMGTSRS